MEVNFSSVNKNGVQKLEKKLYEFIKVKVEEYRVNAKMTELIKDFHRPY